MRDGFALHPSLAFLHGRWAAGELAVQHATATRYRERSHFDAQDVLERGALVRAGAESGWLGRSLAKAGLGGVGIGPSLPLMLRGAADASTWAPAGVPSADEDTLDRLAVLYAEHPALADDLRRARAPDALMGDAQAPARGRATLSTLASATAKLLTAPDGPAAAVLSVDGWDTHANQGAAEGALARRLAGLDEGLQSLYAGLGDAWQQTAVLVLTEFGRTVRPNGTGGTDHGTAGVALLLGGGVRGGRLLGDWPGLADLYEDRDLRPVNDVRALCAGTVAGLWGDGLAVDGVKPLAGLLRG